MAQGGNVSTPGLLGFEIVDTLGHGARSTIYLVRDKRNSQRYALKRVVKNSSADQRFLDQALTEHETAQRFNHPSLRKSYKLYRQRRFFRVSEILVLMEAVEGQTLEQRRVRSMLDVCRIFQDTAIALGVMHRAGYIHSDIKPNNILVTDKDMVKIIDFGQSCPIGTRKERIQGTPDYIAPEQVRREHLTPMTDVFNLGATMYFVLTGRHVPTLIPKGGHIGTAIADSTVNCAPPIAVNQDVPPALSSLVMNCIQMEPRDRPESMTRIYERLELSIAQITNETIGRSTGGDKPVADSSDTGSHDLERFSA